MLPHLRFSSWIKRERARTATALSRGLKNFRHRLAQDKTLAPTMANLII